MLFRGHKGKSSAANIADEKSNEISKKNLGRLPTESLEWLNSEQILPGHGPGDHSVYCMVHMATTACHANGQGRKNP